MPRIALVAGATGGIGRVVADFLGNQGYSVARLSRSITPQATPTSLSVQCDVKVRSSVVSAVHHVASHFGRIDLLVNAIGVASARKITDLTSEDLDLLLQTNVFGTLWLYQAVLEKMKESSGGYIITIGSQRADTPGIGKAAYCASKAAAAQLTKVLAKECKSLGIRVTTINPGYVNSKIYKSETQKVPFDGTLTATEREIKYFSGTVEPEDIGKLILCLDSLSPASAIDEIRLGRIWGN